MKVLIVDDESLARARITKLLKQISDNHKLNIEPFEASNGYQAIDLVNHYDPNILLLDIKMPEMDGIEVANHLANLDNPPAIIFTTAFNEYAIEAFQHNTIAYLLKPVRQELLEKAILSCGKLNKHQLQSLNHITEQENPDNKRAHISVQFNGNILLIPVKDICYFQAENKYVVIIYFKDNRLAQNLTEETLKSLEQEYSDEFIRIHRHSMVRKDLIEALIKKENCVFVQLKACDDLLEVSRRHQAEVRNLIKCQ